MYKLKLIIPVLLVTLSGYFGLPLDDNGHEKRNNNISEIVVKEPINLDENNAMIQVANSPNSSTEKFLEVKIFENNSTTSTSVKMESTGSTRAPSEIQNTKTTKNPRTRRTTTFKPNIKDVNNSIKQPLTRQDWLKLIENEMAFYDKSSGNSPISNKNLTIISERILKYLVENGTQVGISLREQKDGTIKFMKSNMTVADKIYGEGTESKFPPILEFVVQRIQAYFSVYAHEDHSRPAVNIVREEENKINATLREDTENNNGDESTTLSNDEVMEQLEEELNEFIGSDMVKNVTQVKLPSLIKSAYEKIQSWFVPKPAAKEEPLQDSSEEISSIDVDETDKKPSKKPSLIKGAYDAIEAILSVFDDIDVSDEEEKAEPQETSVVELKEAQDDLEETQSIKETVGENLYDFLKLAYTLYDEDDS